MTIPPNVTLKCTVTIPCHFCGEKVMNASVHSSCRQAYDAVRMLRSMDENLLDLIGQDMSSAISKDIDQMFVDEAKRGNL